MNLRITPSVIARGAVVFLSLLTVLLVASCSLVASDLTPTVAQLLDVQAKDWMTNKPHVNASTWVNGNPNRHIGPVLNGLQSRQFVSTLIQHGANPVVMRTDTMFKSPDGSGVASTIIVGLPNDKQNRRFLLDKGDEASRYSGSGEGWQPTPDYGQKYVILQY